MLHKQMRFNRKGQIGPQGLEDLPMAIMAFIVSVGALMIFVGISMSYLEESQHSALHGFGKRLVETLSGEAFRSEASRPYGSRVLDASLVEGNYPNGFETSAEYGFWAEVTGPGLKRELGEEAPEDSLAFSEGVTIFRDGCLENGQIVAKVWLR
jgi:hypothetical protein